MKLLLEKDIWLSEGEGAPLRTTIKEENAKEFDTAIEALYALKEARKYKPFENAQIQEDFL